MDAALKKFIGDISAYFNMNLNDTDKKRLTRFLNEYVQIAAPTVIKMVAVEKPVYIPQATNVIRFKNAPVPPEVVEKHREYMKELAAQICQKHKLTMPQLTTKGRWQEFIDARQEFAFIAMAAGVRHIDIARFLGYRDHSTISHLKHHRKRQPVGVAI